MAAFTAASSVPFRSMKTSETSMASSWVVEGAVPVVEAPTQEASAITTWSLPSSRLATAKRSAPPMPVSRL